jgi:cell division septation protein DedD
MLAFGGGVAGALLVGGGAWWGLSQVGGPHTVPVIEPDPRPFKVRPDDPGGLRVPNQDELIFERNRGSNAQPPDARLAPEPEAPSLEALRAQVAQPAPRQVESEPPAGAPAPASPVPQQSVATQPAAAPPAAAPQPAEPIVARPAPVPNGRFRVQLGALTSEEAARGEWDRLARRHADLLGAFRPQVVRFERDGQTTLFRLRTGGVADAASARAFCEQAQARRIPCIVIR